MDKAKISQELKSCLGTGTVDLGMRLEHHYGILTGQGTHQSFQYRQLQTLDVDLDEAKASNIERLDHIVANLDLELQAIPCNRGVPLSGDEVGRSQIGRACLPVGKPPRLGSESAFQKLDVGQFIERNAGSKCETEYGVGFDRDDSGEAIGEKYRMVADIRAHIQAGRLGELPRVAVQQGGKCALQQRTFVQSVNEDRIANMIAGHTEYGPAAVAAKSR